jgi:hypothetical protein
MSIAYEDNHQHKIWLIPIEFVYINQCGHTNKQEQGK